MKIDVVIGLNYGDEGKGSVTEWRCWKRSKDVAVVRFNGGAQAGHTVVLPDGRKHVFHHFGSGTMDSVPTILSRHFVVDPIMFWQEALQLYPKLSGGLPIVYVDPSCPIVTPYDVFINQEIERARGVDRHGSCGMGIGEAIERAERGYPLTVMDLQHPDEVLIKLGQIASEYVPERLLELDLDPDMHELTNAIDIFTRDANDFLRNVEIKHDHEAIEMFENIVMEGAQGLRLDQYSEDFPYVTRSSTGLMNVAQLIPDRSAEVTVYYVTRTYLTRHGAGPLKGEVENPGIVDDTNINNEFQGSLRFAPLDYERMQRDVESDGMHLDTMSYKKVAVVTHYDQAMIGDDEPLTIMRKVGKAVGTDEVMMTDRPCTR